MQAGLRKCGALPPGLSDVFRAGRIRIPTMDEWQEESHLAVGTVAAVRVWDGRRIIMSGVSTT